MEVLCFILEESAKTVIGLVTTGLSGGLIWLALLRYRSHTIRVLLKNPARVFIFYYRGDHDTSHKKRLAFNADGSINDGKHPNECYWDVAWGLLVIYTNGRKVYSKFRWDQKVGRLIHTNNPNLPSVMGQYIVPLFIPAGQNREIYLQSLGVDGNGR